jgi:hypothetical protein
LEQPAMILSLNKRMQAYDRKGRMFISTGPEGALTSRDRATWTAYRLRKRL